jgi:heat shock protein HtpX
MKRVFLFLATNIAVLVVLAIVLSLLGVERILDEQGVDLNLGALLVFAAVFGFGGSFISLAISKWSAKRMVARQSDHSAVRSGRDLAVRDGAAPGTRGGHRHAGSSVYDAPEPNAFATGARRDNALVAVSTGLLRGMRARKWRPCSRTRSATWRTATW